MAGFARSGKSRGDMVWIRGCLEVTGVARITLRREPLELSCSRAFMAGFAIHSGMRAHQWKTVFMPADGLNCNVPAFDGMARIAIRTELPAMNVGMAIRALLADIGEHQFDVALRALHLLVHALQRIVRLVVVKLWNTADGFPTERRVAVFARNVQSRAVRISSDRFLCLRKSVRWQKNLQQQKKNTDLEQSSEHGNAPGPLPKSFVGFSIAYVCSSK